MTVCGCNNECYLLKLRLVYPRSSRSRRHRELLSAEAAKVNETEEDCNLRGQRSRERDRERETKKRSFLFSEGAVNVFFSFAPLLCLQQHL